MTVAFDVMQQKHLLTSRGQLSDRAVQPKPVEQTRQVQVHLADLFSGRSKFVIGFECILQRSFAELFLAESHQHDIKRDPVKPCGEGGLAAEASDLAKDL